MLLVGLVLEAVDPGAARGVVAGRAGERDDRAAARPDHPGGGVGRPGAARRTARPSDRPWGRGKGSAVHAVNCMRPAVLPAGGATTVVRRCPWTTTTPTTAPRPGPRCRPTTACGGTRRSSASTGPPGAPAGRLAALRVPGRRLDHGAGGRRSPAPSWRPGCSPSPATSPRGRGAPGGGEGGRHPRRVRPDVRGDSGRGGRSSAGSTPRWPASTSSARRRGHRLRRGVPRRRDAAHQRPPGRRGRRRSACGSPTGGGSTAARRHRPAHRRRGDRHRRHRPPVAVLGSAKDLEVGALAVAVGARQGAGTARPSPPA